VVWTGALGELPDRERLGGAQSDLGCAQAGIERFGHQVAKE